MIKKKDKYKKHIGKFPVNSRITVDYTGKKPKVKFGYPSKDDSSTSGTIACALPAMIVLAILAFIIFASSNIEIHDTPESCNVSEDTWVGPYTNRTYFRGISAECLINNQTYNMSFDFNSGNRLLWFYETEPYFYPQTDIKDSLIPVFILLFIFLLLHPLIKFFAWIYKNTKWGNKWFPEINKRFGDSKFSATFKVCPKTKQLELPLFKNIYLDYEATEEFGRYLERVEIREHDFNELIKKGRIKPKKKGEKRKRKIIKKKNIWLWKATFFFSKQPKKGQLEIQWT